VTRRGVLVTSAVGGLVACIAAANLYREPGAIELDWRLVKPPPREVAVETPSRGPIVQTVTAPGAVEPVDEAEIASQVVGRVIAVNVKDGDSVKKGDLLVKLEETEARAQLDSAGAKIERLKAAIVQAEAEREKAERDLIRSRKLAARDVATPTELADARSSFAKAVAALEMCRKELAESEAMRRTSQQYLDRTSIRAPIDGVVAGLEVEVGEVVIAGTTNLPGTVMMTVGDLSRMRVRADVDETDVPLVRPHEPARVFLQADLGHPIPGQVDRVAPKGKKTDEVVSFETLIEVAPDNPALHSGMTATVEIEVQRSIDALGIPVQAVVHRRRKDLPDTPAVRAWIERHGRTPGEKAKDAETRYVKIVFVLEAGIAHARPVETGISDERRVEILSGLKPTDRVIVGPFRALDELKDGNPAVVANKPQERANTE
jgi:HlyD family secretion protein